MARQATEHAATLEHQHQQLVAAMGSLDKASLQNEEQQQAEFESELSSMRQLHEQSLFELQAQHVSELSKLQLELTQAHQTDLALKLGALNQQHEQELTQQTRLSQQAAEAAALAMDDLRIEHDQAQAEVLAEHGRALQQIQDAASLMESELTHGLTKQVEALHMSLKQQQEAALCQLQQASEASLASTRQEHWAQVQQLEEQLQDLHEQLQTSSADHGAQLEAVIAAHQVCMQYAAAFVGYCIEDFASWHATSASFASVMPSFDGLI